MTNEYDINTRAVLLIYLLFSGQQIQYKDQHYFINISFIQWPADTVQRPGRCCRINKVLSRYCSDVSQLTAMLRSVWTRKINYPSNHRATVCIILSSLTRLCVDELNVCGRSQLWNAVCSLSSSINQTQAVIVHYGKSQMIN